ncbi:hypothetical protein AB1N83_000283 [Pleurotus pulmonarius]
MGVSCPVDGCDLLVDAVFRARDGTQYGAHARNLEQFSMLELFPASTSSMMPEVDLPEDDAQVLSLLCEFLHPNHMQPDVSLLTWETFCKLAAVVEQYKIYNAMALCKLKMEYSVEEHPYEVFQYASTTNYESLRDRAMKLCFSSHPLECFVKACELGLTDLMDEAALKTLNLPTADVEEALRGTKNWQLTLLAWMAQREALRERQHSLLLNPTAGPQHKGGSLRCEDWHTYYNAVVLKCLKRSDGNLTEAIMSTRPLVQGCSYCLRAVEMWGRNVDTTLIAALYFGTLRMYQNKSPTSRIELPFWRRSSRRWEATIRAPFLPRIHRPSLMQNFGGKLTVTNLEVLPKCPTDESCRLPVDVIIKCSDGTSHGAHARNLEFHCDSFPLRSFDSDLDLNNPVEEIIVAEDGETMALLCKFIHRQKQPDLETLEWAQFARLAAAVEKYGVFAAMEVCKMKMSSLIETHPYDVYLYASAAKNVNLSTKALGLCMESHPLECFINANEAGLSDLRDKAALKTLDMKAEDVLSALKNCKHSTVIFTAWVRQREKLLCDGRAVLESPPTGIYHKGGFLRCSLWEGFYNAVCLDMYKSMGLNFRTTTEKHRYILSGCIQCTTVVDLWRKNYESLVVPLPFSTFL